MEVLSWRKARIGISACLLGETVRYDGGHQRDPLLLETLGPFVEWIPVCPEVEAGMGVPREPVRLVGDPSAPRLVGTRTGRDWTETMQTWAARRIEELAVMNLDGFILKKNSPTCGLFRVRIYTEAGTPFHAGTGFFARMLVARFPMLPVEEEGRLRDPRLREHFIARVYIHQRWREWQADAFRPAGLVRFHTEHKLLLLAYSPAHLRRLGQLVAEAGRRWPAVVKDYEAVLAQALQVPPSRGRLFNVLTHAMGFLREVLSPADRAEFQALLEAYRRGEVPLIGPIVLLRHHLRHPGISDWLRSQRFMIPYPDALGLRNAI